MKRISLCGDGWSLYCVKNERYKRDVRRNGAPTGTESLKALGYESVTASVPGNPELDLYRAGKRGDAFFGMMPHDRELEYTHFFYVTGFSYDGCLESPELYLEGVDTVAEIYLNGELVGRTDNMLIPHCISVNNAVKTGENELTVHIIPATVVARSYEITPNDFAMKYNFDSLYVRKAPHMYGWDIMPRMLSGGIWRPVWLRERRSERIKEDECFIYTVSVNPTAETARIAVNYNVSVDGDDISEYTVTVRGKCGESEFYRKERLWHTGGNMFINVSSAKLWWPRNAGEANLYDVTLTLYRGETEIDRWEKRVGIRTVMLDRSSITDKDGNGEFRFLINGKPIFAMGSNWVPADALHSRDAERIPRIMPMLSELGCNIIRVWGGGVYEDEALYDYCDRDGIMVWQDFIMGCANYPQDGGFLRRMETEIEAAVRRLRNHASIVLWAGDNENDIAYLGWYGIRRDPNKVNIITRKLIPACLDRLDFSRPYLPSSPYVDDAAFASGGGNISEDHLWGPRDYFKGKFYSESICHFASETGYHGCPSPDSLARFISEEKLWTATEPKRWDGIVNDEWLAHATAMETVEGAPYTYRIRLMADQVTTLFGESVPCRLEDFSRASQISQAEAKKYFIERFRLSKWRRTGIIWWNLIDGWPQISDAVVDYYFTKKLAYGYIKRSQQPLCLMCDEPVGNILPLFAVNDGDLPRRVTYNVTDLTSEKSVCHGTYEIAPDASAKINEIEIRSGEKHFYYIEWKCGDTFGSNHYMTNIRDVDYAEYLGYIERCGYAEWQGFGEKES